MLAHCGAPDPKAELAVLQVLDAEHGLISIRGLSEVMAQLGLSYEQTFTTVMKCAFAGKVEVNPTEPYSPSSQVWAL